MPLDLCQQRAGISPSTTFQALAGDAHTFTRREHLEILKKRGGHAMEVN